MGKKGKEKGELVKHVAGCARQKEQLVPRHGGAGKDHCTMGRDEMGEGIEGGTPVSNIEPELRTSTKTE